VQLRYSLACDFPSFSQVTHSTNSPITIAVLVAGYAKACNCAVKDICEI